jgi:hypothetical protein
MPTYGFVVEDVFRQQVVAVVDVVLLVRVSDAVQVGEVTVEIDPKSNCSANQPVLLLTRCLKKRCKYIYRFLNDIL